MPALMRGPRSPLAREVTAALAFKAVALALLYVAFFGPWQRPEVTPADVEAVLLDIPPVAATAASREERPR